MGEHVYKTLYTFCSKFHHVLHKTHSSYGFVFLLGRTARIRGNSRSELREILQMAILAGFDWVFYADNDYCRVSVIPDGKKLRMFYHIRLYL